MTDEINPHRMTEMLKDGNDQYLGDGVYVSHDGYYIWLAAVDPRNKVVAVGYPVMLKLIRYAHEIGLISGETKP